MAAVVASVLKLGTKKPKKRRKLDKSELALISHTTNVVIKPFPKFPPRWVVAGKEGQTQKKPTDTMTKLLMGKELLRQKSKSSDALSREYYDEDGAFKNNAGQAYSSIYIGLVLICIGLVITFVGLGEKGFKTLELKMIGPVLCLIGLSCIVYKVLQCTFPKLFEHTSCFKQGNKLADSDQSNLMEKGAQNGHLGNSKKTSPQTLSPRVTLHSSKNKVSRPRSTIPNYIEDTSDEDDFNPNKNRPQSNRYFDEEPSHQPEVSVDASVQPLSSPMEPPKHYLKKNEVLLNPKTLML